MDSLSPTLAPASARPAPLSSRPPALYLMEPRVLDLVYGPAERARLESSLHFVLPPQSIKEHASLPAEQRAVIEVIVTSWGMPRLTPDFLALYPRLRGVFCGAGSARGFVTAASWQRGVRIITAAGANALPVAEYAFAHTILGLKRAWFQAMAMRTERRVVRPGPVPTGTYGSTIGVLALGHIGRLMVQRLHTLDVKILAYDPYVTSEQARALGVTLVTLDEIFSLSDVVSCHLPLIPETEGMLRGAHFRRMQPGAVFINTARGRVIVEAEMLQTLRERPDLFAVIDVTDPEPPHGNSALFDLPNVFLTPHIAGSLGPECRRLGASIAADVEKFVLGQPIANELLEAEASRQA